MKKRTKVMIAVIILFIFLVPFPTKYKDGLDIRIMGFHIYNNFE